MAAVTLTHLPIAVRTAAQTSSQGTSRILCQRWARRGSTAFAASLPAVSHKAREVRERIIRLPVPKAVSGGLAIDTESETGAPAITLSEKALSHLLKMRSSQQKDLLLRIGVRQGGCSGYSYIMDFEDRSNIQEGDSIIEYNGFSMVCDPKSLLFLYGMQLDYSDALIGGGFAFTNPNASSTCGCGKSFAA